MFKMVGQRPLITIGLVSVVLSSCTSTAPNISASSTKGAAERAEDEKKIDVEPSYLSEIQLTNEQQQGAGIEVMKVGGPGANGQLSTGLIELSSTVESPADSTGIVYSPATGVVTRVLVDVGDYVKKGQVVAYVNSPDISDAQAAYLDAMAKLSEAKAQIEAVDARIEVSKSSVNRLTQLNKEGIAAKKDVETAQSAQLVVEAERAAALGKLNASKAHIEAAKVKLIALGLNPPADDLVQITGAENARAEKSRSKNSGSGNKSVGNTGVGHPQGVTTDLPIRSPVNGVVVKKEVNPGQSVGPGTMAGSAAEKMGGNRQSSLLTIADLHKVWVMLEVPQREVPNVKLGGLINFKTESIPDRQFAGRITRIAQTFDPQSRTAQYRGEIDNPGALLKPGMLVIASLKIMTPSGDLTVPPSAVQTIANKDVAFIRADNNRFMLREVECGERSDKAVKIKKGLTTGESVVVKGSFYLKSEAMKSQIGGGAGSE